MTTTERVNRLREYRDALVRPKVSRESLAHAAGITSKTYRNAEMDASIRYDTACAILKALNVLRKQRGMAEIGVENLGLNYQ